MSSSIPPGWYDDPAGPGNERWWDGTQWTESTRPATDQGGIPAAPGPQPDSSGPPSEPPPVSAAPTMAAAGPPPGGPGGPGAPGAPYGAYGGPPPPGSGSPMGMGGPPPPGSGSPMGMAGAAYPPGPPPSGGTGNRNRTILISVAALVVVGGLVAALVLLLGGGDDDPEATDTHTPTTTSQTDKPAPKPGLATDGTLTDENSGIALPKMKEWTDHEDPSESPARQYKGEIPCTGDTTSPDAGESSGCYLGEIDVATFEATDLDDLVGRLTPRLTDNEEYRTTNTVKDEGVTVDGKAAHLLVIEVEEKNADAAGARRTATLQFIFIDHPYDDGTTKMFPIVYVGIDGDSKAPPKEVIDVVREGIKINTPRPTAS